IDARETPDSLTTSSTVVLPMPKRATHASVASRTRSRGSACTLTPSWWRGNGGFADRSAKPEPATATEGKERARPGGGRARFLASLLARSSVSALELDVLRRLR